MDSNKMLRRVIKKLESNRVIDDSTGCWLWTGPVDPNGYGRTTFNSKSIGVHRLSAHIWLGYNILIKYNREQVNHIRECPSKHCFNPKHIYIGTQSQNVLDYNVPIEDRICPNGHSMKSFYFYKSKDGKIFRWCRECKRLANAKRSKK